MGLLAEVLLQVATHEEVELLVGAAELDVGSHRDGVVALGQRIEHLEHRDRLVRRPALGEIVALEDARYRGRRGQLEDLLGGEPAEPLAVVRHLESGRIVVEDEQSLLLVGARVGVDDRGIEAGPRLGAARGVADARRVVADDEHGDVTGVLELAQLVEDDRVPQVDVGRGGVDAELDAQRPALALGAGKLGGEGSRGQHLDGAYGQVVDEALVGHGAADDTTGSAGHRYVRLAVA